VHTARDRPVIGPPPCTALARVIGREHLVIMP
jgi:hypothetical protein